MAHLRHQLLPFLDHVVTELPDHVMTGGEILYFAGVSERPVASASGCQRRLRTLTLIEVVAVLAVLAILGALALRAMRPTGVTLTAERGLLATQLRYVQAMAMAGGTEHVWGLQVQATGYGLVRDRVQPVGVSLPGCPGAARLFPSGVSSSPVLVEFDAWGGPLDASGSPVAADISIALTDGNTSQLVVVTAVTGFVR